MVQTAMPEVEGVAAGAILSNYQRVRVEHVSVGMFRMLLTRSSADSTRGVRLSCSCARLGLVPIAYLWQRDQRELLNEMVVSGQESVLVKVAGAGSVSLSAKQLLISRLSD